jgi:hypothetical protein
MFSGFRMGRLGSSQVSNIDLIISRIEYRGNPAAEATLHVSDHFLRHWVSVFEGLSLQELSLHCSSSHPSRRYVFLLEYQASMD